MRPTGIYIAITCADDSIAIMQFFTKVETKEEAWEREPTTEAIEFEIAKTMLLPEQRPIKEWHIINASDTPSDRTFRGAWRKSGKKVVVDMPIAREIHKERLRINREPLLAALDVEYQRADEEKDKAKKDTIVAKKQALRDITKHPDIDKAKTPEELLAVVLPAN